MGSFWNELKRRNVVRVGIANALVAWVGLVAQNPNCRHVYIRCPWFDSRKRDSCTDQKAEL